LKCFLFVDIKVTTSLQLINDCSFSDRKWTKRASKLAQGERIPHDFTISSASWRIFCALDAPKCVCGRFSVPISAGKSYSATQTPSWWGGGRCPSPKPNATVGLRPLISALQVSGRSFGDGVWSCTLGESALLVPLPFLRALQTTN